MQSKINQAVVFTKPMHHLGLPLTSARLAEKVRTFLEEKSCRIVFSKKVSGSELADRNVIKEHYLMYSRAACIESVDELGLSDEAKEQFESAFGKSWQDEAAKVFGSPALQQEKGISAHELYLRWNGQLAHKIQKGLFMAYLEGLDCYCINAFYPAMEEIFYNPATEMTYYVVEFDPEEVSWAQFRKKILGATDASKADPGSFRGQLYATYGAALEYPGRDNFVHGSAGPVEGLVERIIHEPDFDMAANPLGHVLAQRGIDAETFKRWKANQSISQLGALFNATEEKNTAETLGILAEIRF